MKKKGKILFICQELNPFIQITDNSINNINLLKAIKENNYDVRVLMPKFGCINNRKHRLHDVIRLSCNIIDVCDKQYPLFVKVASYSNYRLQIYFLDNKYFFGKKNIKDDVNNHNDEKLIFFCKSSIEIIKKLGWIPDIISCQGWITSLIPVLIKNNDDSNLFLKTKIVYNLYTNDTFKGTFFNKNISRYLNIENKNNDMEKSFLYNDLQKYAIKYSDITVSDISDDKFFQKKLSINDSINYKIDYKKFITEYMNIYRFIMER
ncbi:MAG: glycogen/starch synthase [Bacteroides sp.]|nr:MAG: glycogen/starch synthase [Bacteroides sp.]